MRRLDRLGQRVQQMTNGIHRLRRQRQRRVAHQPLLDIPGRRTRLDQHRSNAHDIPLINRRPAVVKKW